MKQKVTLIKDRTDFTDEQRKMIEQIGEKHKNRKNYYLNRFYFNIEKLKLDSFSKYNRITLWTI